MKSEAESNNHRYTGEHLHNTSIDPPEWFIQAYPTLGEDLLNKFENDTFWRTSSESVLSSEEFSKQYDIPLGDECSENDKDDIRTTTPKDVLPQSSSIVTDEKQLSFDDLRPTTQNTINQPTIHASKHRKTARHATFGFGELIGRLIEFPSRKD